MVTKKPHIVVLGAGIGGLAAALSLERQAKAGNFNVSVIDRDRNHCYHALLYQSATAFGIDHPERSSFLRSSAVVPVCGLPHSALFNELHLIRGEVQSIDRTQRRVQLADGTHVSFDYLIFSLGSCSNDFGICGVADYALPLRTESDAGRIREGLERCRDRAMRGEQVRCIIAGAGVSGIELAGACATEIQALVQEGKLQAGDFQIELIEASPTILPGFPTKAQTIIHQRLSKLGVKITCQRALAEVTAGEAIYRDTSRQSYDLMLWCGGLFGHPLLSQLGGSQNTKRQIEVNTYFQLPTDRHIFVIGDAATAVDPATHRPLPQTAAVAVSEGRFVAAYLVKMVQQKNPPAAYRAPIAPIAIPIGHRFAVAIQGTTVIVGWRAWTLRKWLDWKYFRSIAPWQSAWSMFRRGFFPPFG